MSDIDPSSQSPGEVVAANPAAARVFHAHGIDFCCGAHTTLADACGTLGLAMEPLLAELRAAAEGGPEPISWESYSLDEVVSHIRERYHVPMEQELPRLLALARKVEHLFGTDPRCPHGLADLLDQITRELLAHQRREEEALFPLLVASPSPELALPLRMMLEEHQDHDEHLRHIRLLTDDLEAPPETCMAWVALYHGLHLFERELMEHMHVENHILAPRVMNTPLPHASREPTPP